MNFEEEGEKVKGIFQSQLHTRRYMKAGFICRLQTKYIYFDLWPQLLYVGFLGKKLNNQLLVCRMQHVLLHPNKLYVSARDHSPFFWDGQWLIGLSTVCLYLSAFVLATWWLKRNTIGPRPLFRALRSSITSSWTLSPHRQSVPLSSSNGPCSV